MRNDSVLFLNCADTRKLLDMDACIAAVEQAFRLYGLRKAVAPAVCGIHARDGGFHIKAGLLELERPYFAAKVNGNFPSNSFKYALPTIQGAIVLCDATNGSPLAIMDSREITSLRTAAATAVAAKYLARQDSRVVTVCGCGVQGRVQVKALSRVCDLRTIFAYDVDFDRARVFAHEVAEALGLTVVPIDAMSEGVSESDICVTCTPSQRALLAAEDVHQGMLIAAVGADNPLKQELAPDLLAISKIICDVTEQCAAMGDLHHAFVAGKVTQDKVHAELGEVIAGKKPGRESYDELIVFDSTGMALQDVAAAACLYEAAQRTGAGAQLEFRD